MLLLHEIAGLLEVKLYDDLRYSLRFGNLVSYQDGEKTFQGKKSRYEFRSVEQLRYDFERDVAAAGGALGGEGP